MCDCIQEIMEQKKSLRGAVDVRLVNFYPVSWGDDIYNYEHATAIALTFPKTEDKRTKNRVEHVYVRHDFCPFCGEEQEFNPNYEGGFHD